VFIHKNCSIILNRGGTPGEERGFDQIVKWYKPQEERKVMFHHLDDDECHPICEPFDEDRRKRLLPLHRQHNRYVRRISETDRVTYRGHTVLKDQVQHKGQQQAQYQF